MAPGEFECAPADRGGQNGKANERERGCDSGNPAHVRCLHEKLPSAVAVGTVDKFQGQQAPISLYSMTTSSPELAPRGMDFLYSRNRLNVATSRARCIAVVVASPDLLRVRARTPEQMRLANAFCRFAELAQRPLPRPIDRTEPDVAVEVLTLGLR